jgi:tRNA threonylcarbamoyladenosine biosynthesis protein TsaB
MSAPSEHRLILIETSVRNGQIGLGDGERVLAQRQLDQARRHARDLAPALRDLLHEQGWRPTAVTAVVVSLGPGSYTGLRVGIMSAKAFAFAVGCPILGIDTFAVLAHQAGPGAPIEVISDAQQRRVNAQRFHFQSAGFPVANSPLRALDLSQWLAELPAEARVTGPGLETFLPELPPARCMPTDLWQPTLASLHRLAMTRLAAGQNDDLWRLEPLYVRPSSAEEQWVKLGR